MSERYDKYLAERGAQDSLSPQQFYHGSSTSFGPGDLIDPSQDHERVHSVSLSGSAYFTRDKDAAHMYANLAAEKTGGDPHVYQVEPTGSHHSDFQTRRNPDTRMTSSPLKVLGEEK